MVVAATSITQVIKYTMKVLKASRPFFVVVLKVKSVWMLKAKGVQRPADIPVMILEHRLYGDTEDQP